MNLIKVQSRWWNCLSYFLHCNGSRQWKLRWKRCLPMQRRQKFLGKPDPNHKWANLKMCFIKKSGNTWEIHCLFLWDELILGLITSSLLFSPWRRGCWHGHERCAQINLNKLLGLVRNSWKVGISIAATDCNIGGAKNDAIPQIPQIPSHNLVLWNAKCDVTRLCLYGSWNKN